jgi:hypothetical protein
LPQGLKIKSYLPHGAKKIYFLGPFFKLFFSFLRFFICLFVFFNVILRGFTKTLTPCTKNAYPHFYDSNRLRMKSYFALYQYLPPLLIPAYPADP